VFYQHSLPLVLDVLDIAILQDGKLTTDKIKAGYFHATHAMFLHFNAQLPTSYELRFCSTAYYRIHGEQNNNTT
jgi:hypothetical protein